MVKSGIRSLAILKYRRHHRMVRLFVQSLPLQAQEIQPAKAGFVLLAPGFQPAGGLAGKQGRNNYVDADYFRDNLRGSISNQIPHDPERPPSP